MGSDLHVISGRKVESERVLGLMVNIYSVGASYSPLVSQQPECHSSQSEHMKHGQAFSRHRAFTVALPLLGIPFLTIQPFFPQKTPFPENTILLTVTALWKASAPTLGHASPPHAPLAPFAPLFHSTYHIGF